MKIKFILCFLFFVKFIFAQQVKDPEIEKILARLSLQEKAGQLNLIVIKDTDTLTAEKIELIKKGKVGAVLKANGAKHNYKIQKIAVEQSTNGIPIIFQEDVIHGYKTIAPIPLAEAASWDMQAIRKSAAVAAREATASGIHLTYAPMVDICRDPRWGRIIEAAGEDSFLGSKVATARVKGFQESGEETYQNILGCVKHFAGYGASLAGRDYNIMDFSERELREVHLPPFQAAVDAGVASLMCAYTAYDAIPACANSFLLKDVLRKEMGFNGTVITDWSTVSNLVKIGVSPNNKEAVKVSINAGVDVDMTSEKFVALLPDLVKNGIVSEEVLDNAVRNVLILKKKAGLFKDPYAYFNEKREKKEHLSTQNIAETKEIALKSMVLLKNAKNTLPLNSSKIKKIALIGPFAKAKEDLMGWWACKGDPKDVTSIYEGLVKEFGAKNIAYAPGCKIDSFKLAGKHLIQEALKTVQQSDVVVMALGEEFWMSGEGGGTAGLHLPGLQEQLLEEVAKQGKPIVSVIATGRPYVLTKVDALSDAVLQAWMPGTVGGTAVAEILSGKFNPCGKLPVTFPYHEGQIPIFYNYRRTSHPFNAGPKNNRYSTTHRDIPSQPLYPFGFGLSYTDYEYSKITLSSNQLKKGSEITASVNVKNIGTKKGREIVQMYIRDEVCSITRPLLELKGFDILELLPGETKTVTFKINSTMLSFIDKNYKKSVEAGEFTIFIGPNSAQKSLKKSTFELK